MPAQYRALKDMAKYIDISLNFLKSRKTTAGIQVSNSTYIPFTDIKQSVSITQRKQLTIKHFKQILTIMPDHWTHKWQGSELMVNFGEGKIFLNMVEQNQR